MHQAFGRRLRGGSFGLGSARHSSGARSITCGSVCRRSRENTCRNARTSQPRDTGNTTRAPKRPVIKPGIIIRIPPSAAAIPVPSRVTPATWAFAARRRVTAPPPTCRSTKAPESDTRTSRTTAVAVPTKLATTMNAAISATGSASSPKAIPLTGCIGPNSPIMPRKTSYRAISGLTFADCRPAIGGHCVGVAALMV